MIFIINGEPVPQARPRFSTKGGFARAYDDPKSKQAKADVLKQVRMELLKHPKFEPITSPICLKLSFYRSIPKSKSKKYRENAKKGVFLPVSRPDLDNYTKLVKDALNGILWSDDAQVVELHAKKLYSDTPRTEINITEIVIDDKTKNTNA